MRDRDSHTIADDAQWKAATRSIELGSGLCAFLTRIATQDDLILQPQFDMAGPAAHGLIAISGHVDAEMPDGLHAIAGPDHALLFRPAAAPMRYHVGGPQQLRLVSYALRLDRAERIFDGAIPPALAPLFEPDMAGSRIIRMQAARRLRYLAESLFSPGLKGLPRRLFIEGVVLQLLACQLASQVRRSEPITRREREATITAHRLLLMDMCKPPGLGDLAAAVGLSEKRLNTCFRSEFGGTAFEVLRNHRLEHARIALAARAVPLKQIAYRVGYNHVTNFINAFTARYGTSPGRYAGMGEG